MVKKILIGLLVVLVLIQFIRPSRNIGNAQTPTDITHFVQVPDSTLKILQVACYDCHSNNTKYPWYANVSPVSLWLDNHIRNGKRKLNFSDFSTMPAKKMAHRMDDIAETVEKKEMPLKSYLWIHDEARLTDAQRKQIIDWAKAAQSGIVVK